MPQAVITVNGTPGSNTDLPIATPINLSNQNSGGETTYAWSIVDQPAGTADTLSNPAIQSPTLTPNKEGTYLLRLVVNGTLQNQVVVAVRQLKTRLRVPAAGETVEASSSEGWHGTPSASGMEVLLQRVDSAIADPMLVVGVSGSTTPVRGNVVYASGNSVIKSGLPGQETVPTFDIAQASSATEMAQALFVVEGGVDGNASPVLGALISVRRVGRFNGQTSGSPSIGDDVFVSNAGVLALSAGTNRRKVGTVMATYLGLSGPAFDTMFDSSVIDESFSPTGLIHANGSVAWLANQSVGGFGFTSLQSLAMLSGATISGAADITVNPAGKTVFEVAASEIARIDASGLAVGATVTHTASISVPNSGATPSAGYGFVKGGTFYTALTLDNAGNVWVGDTAGGSGGTNLVFVIAGTLAYNLSLTNLNIVAPVWQINSVTVLAKSGSNINVADGLTSTAGILELNGGGNSGGGIALVLDGGLSGTLLSGSKVSGSTGSGAQVQFSSGIRSQSRTVSSNYSAKVNDKVINVDSTSSAINVTLPTIASVGIGTELEVNDVGNNANANPITILAASGPPDNVNGAVSKQITTNNGGARLRAVSANAWRAYTLTPLP